MGTQKFETTLKPIGENRFLLTGIKNKVELVSNFNKNASRPSIELIKNGGKPAVFKPVSSAFDSPEKLVEYAGTYHSDELNTNYKVMLRDNNIVIRLDDSNEVVLTSRYADFLTGMRRSFKRLRGRH